MVIQTVPYRLEIEHDGRKYDVAIPALSVPKCTNCEAISIDDEADRQIDAAFRRVARLLSPEEIRRGRTDAGYNQQVFADCLGVAVSTVSRWENGVQIQQRFHDGVIRAFFALPELQRFLANLHGVATSPAFSMVQGAGTNTHIQPAIQLPTICRYAPAGTRRLTEQATTVK
jgi:DNA-binding transcriptional regulator YiaG